MSTLSFKERLDLLEHDLRSSPPNFILHRELPFCILRYDPPDEWKLRRQLKLLATRIAETGRDVKYISMADLLWRAIDQAEGIEAIAELERSAGFDKAQEQVTSYLQDPDWTPLSDVLAAELAKFDPKTDIAFLVRVAALAPHIYYVSKLLEEMKGRSRVPGVLFYPGSIEGTTGLRFMNMPAKDAPLGNYRVQIYG